jgi:hypothetical protein
MEALIGRRISIQRSYMGCRALNFTGACGAFTASMGPELCRIRLWTSENPTKVKFAEHLPTFMCVVQVHILDDAQGGRGWLENASP